MIVEKRYRGQCSRVSVPGCLYFPGWEGCTDVIRERVEIHVTTAGAVELLSAEPLCFGVVPCYD